MVTSSQGIPDAPVPAPPAATVVAVVTVVAGVDPAATVAAVSRQAHSPASISLVGAADAAEAPGVVQSADLESVVSDLDPSVDYVWILHGDAEPRPDALGALVAEAERFEASLAGSKLLVAGTPDTLESVGSATDVFGEPYSGLEEGEVDLEQYDVVRDVAFVSSVSMLVRRDLLRGLGGIDAALAPVAAGLDLSQRVRVAGGRVIVVPSSEVFHQRRCGRGDGGWREQSSRLRAMLKAYRAVTLAWVIPFAFIVGFLDSLGSLLLGRWRLAPRYLVSWLWNLWRLPSTVAARRRLNRVRQVGDEELFRYQTRGSVRLRQVGSELSDRLLALFDEESVLARRATEAWWSAGAWGLVAALAVVLVGVRAVFLSGLGAVGYSLPFGDRPLESLAWFLTGWSPAGLGGPGAVHPSVLPAAALQLLVLGHGEVARSLITLGAFTAGVVGTGRLAVRLRAGGGGAHFGGVVALFGFPAALLAGEGRWAGLVGLGILPWAILGVVGHAPGSRRRWWGVLARQFSVVALLACFSPYLVVVPLLVALVLRGRFPTRPGMAALATAGGLVALPFLIERAPIALGGIPVAATTHPGAVVLVTAAGLLAMLSGAWRVGAVGSAAALGGLALAPMVGPDLGEALLAASALGTGMVAAAALRSRPQRRPLDWLAILAGAALVVVSVAGLAGGRGGMPADAWERSLDFVSISPLPGERVMLVAPEPRQLPGESHRGPGFWYRLLDGRGATLDQTYLGPTTDRELDAAVAAVASADSVRPGERLAPFGIRWLVLVGDDSDGLGTALEAQTDLTALPLAAGMTVYENNAFLPRIDEPPSRHRPDPLAATAAAAWAVAVVGGLGTWLWARRGP